MARIFIGVFDIWNGVFGILEGVFAQISAKWWGGKGIKVAKQVRLFG